MKRKSIFGIIVVIIGAGLLFFSNYISTQVSEGKLKIKNAQNQINSANSYFSESQYTKPIGNIFTKSAQNKVNAGQLEVDKYGSMSRNLQVIGIILLICGGAILVLGQMKKKR